MNSRTRANGEGTIVYRKKEGRFMALAYFPTPDGKKARKCFYGKTEEEARLKMKAALNEAQRWLYD